MPRLREDQSDARLSRRSAAALRRRGARGWSTAIDPIDAPGGRLATLRDCAGYILALPLALHERAPWQLAMQLLILVAEGGGDTMLPRIAMLRALSEGKPVPAIAPRRKPARRYRVIS